MNAYHILGWILAIAAFEGTIWFAGAVESYRYTKQERWDAFVGINIMFLGVPIAFVTLGCVFMHLIGHK